VVNQAVNVFRILGQSLVALIVLTARAAAITVCYPREEMLSYISRDVVATKHAAGIVRPYSVMEVWVSDEDGDWLIVTTDIDGSSCIVAYGEDFTFSALPTPQEKG